ncbi:thiamine/thiamine pyrophosphate ABC transporter permease ThiP [Alphaproteobacteria bacterium KMM 3653]|uniref:Thiamine/thiamine pyrophosphate ABC transporter permease ThiP n=2 Tax=Harenicola maris TaxID=2841044 RepID=A0AAP2CS43_9RHOB|nr:thiamine/thiamine pyrophosphate ABC transporter permease ThiP [Harenicola maris]
MLCLTLGTLAAVLMRAERGAGFGPGDWQALRFTLWQALWSAALSIACAIPVARALARRQFRGRGVLITLLGAPFILPTLVAVLGLVAVFGRNGPLNAALAGLGLPEVSIYGPWGVVLAHVFFNMPLAVRLLLQGWLAIPAERFRLAASLGFGPRQMIRHIEWPMLRATAPGAALVIFAICLTSFAVALALGGGPRATTVELAIYQAFRFDVDLGKAAQLASVQFALAGAAALLALRLSQQVTFGAGLDGTVARWDASGRGHRALDAFWLILAAGFLLLPLGAVVLRGLPGLTELPPVVWWSLWRSLWVALLSTALVLTLSLPLAVMATGKRGAWVEVLSTLAIAASPLVIGTGLYLMVFPFIWPGDVALIITALVNAALALPFALRSLLPQARSLAEDYGRLSASLQITGWPLWRWVILPRLRRPLGFAAGLTAALSMGDLGVIALFADPDRATLPLQMYRLMGAYRIEAASAAALLLLSASLALFWAFDMGGRANAGP